MSIKLEVGQIWHGGTDYIWKITNIEDGTATGIRLPNGGPMSFAILLSDGSGDGLNNGWKLLTNYCEHDCCRGKQ